MARYFKFENKYGHNSKKGRQKLFGFNSQFQKCYKKCMNFKMIQINLNGKTRSLILFEKYKKV